MRAAPTVSGLSFTPVKGTRLHTCERLEIERGGPVGDRAFYVVDERGRMLNGKVLGELSAVVAEAIDGRLRLSFPDGSVVEDAVRDGETVQARFYSRPRGERLVEGPFSEALSSYLGRPLRLLHAGGPSSAIDRGVQGAVSLVSRGSLDALAEAAGIETVDVRRFRMTIEIDGVEPHAEDAWVGRVVRVGASARVRLRGHVGRCMITSRQPDTGVVDLPTLEALGSYRGEVDSTEPLPFGVYGEVLTPGVVSLGDSVLVEG